MPFARRPGHRPRSPVPSDRLERLLADRTRDPDPTPGAAEADPWSETPTDPTMPGGRTAPPTPASGRRPGRHRGDPEMAAPPLLSLPVSLRTAQVVVRPAAALGMVVVLVLVTAVLGVRWWQTEQAARPQPLPVQAPVAPDGGSPLASGPDGEGAGPGGAGAGAVEGTATLPVQLQVDGPDPPGAAVLVVHVTGSVQRPGVVELTSGARVRDAVEAAGGLSAEADTVRINLARPVSDGERIWVPAPGQDEPLPVGPSGTDPAGVAGPAGGAAPGAGSSTAVVDLNTADQPGLEQLPGVGPKTAQAILAWRQEHGRFSAVEELLEISGIGERTLERLRPHVTW